MPDLGGACLRGGIHVSSKAHRAACIWLQNLVLISCYQLNNLGDVAGGSSVAPQRIGELSEACGVWQLDVQGPPRLQVDPGRLCTVPWSLRCSSDTRQQRVQQAAITYCSFMSK